MIKLIKSTFYHEQQTKQALADFILKQNIFSMNEQCAKFETAFAIKQQRKHAVFVQNGSVANFLLVQSMLNSGRLNKDDKVGFSALTWPTNVMPLIQLGLVPVALDCNIATLNVSPEIVDESAEQIKCLFLTNVLGFCDDLAQIKKICDEHNIILLEDNCESLGSKMDGKQLGNFGLASTFSFFVGHHMSTIEGGMICTDDDELHQLMVMGRSHGWDRNLNADAQIQLREKHGIDDFYAKYTFYDLASNFRPNEIAGFIGNIQIKYWDDIVRKRVSNFTRYISAMKTNKDFYQYNLSHMDIVSNFAMPIICKTSDLARAYRKKFENADVEIRPVIAGNITKQPFFQKYIQDSVHRPNSDLVHANGFYFGNNPDMADKELDTLCKLLA
ncbi:MAG TPA: DegT/DnrJ/EryC1/StrS aminotransferase family protein [Candidatus Saccharimonadales bacterium]|jgi:CDP-6-deoxy-D-xylo-4-hexulose-3-dehydrase|nr:DegT/DnrJ/EryC1/StrS aminotransferase family protein [Candidatus Saccharimonadales bacterium]